MVSAIPLAQSDLGGIFSIRKSLFLEIDRFLVHLLNWSLLKHNPSGHCPLCADRGFLFAYRNLQRDLISKYISPKNHPPVVLATIQVTTAAVVLLPTFIAYGFNSYEFSYGPILAITVIGFFSTGFAFAWNYQIVSLVGSSVAATVSFVTPIVAVLAGVLVLSEPLSWNEPLGGAIVILGNAITQRAHKA